MPKDNKGLSGKSYMYATLNRFKRMQAHAVPLKVFDEENVLFSLSSEGIAKILMDAEREQSMTNYERG